VPAQRRGLHLVVLYLNLGHWRIPWSFESGAARGSSPAQLASVTCNCTKSFDSGCTCDCLPTLSLARLSFSTVPNAVWRERCNRKPKMVDVSNSFTVTARGQQIKVEGITLHSLFLGSHRQWQTRTALCRISTHPYSEFIWCA